jgi:UDP-N-acetylmuramoylalanine--D-glutamate ligase
MMEQVENVKKTSGVLVIGLARSGFAAAKLLLEKGYSVRVSELLEDREITEKRRTLESNGVLVETGTHTEDFLVGVDLVVASPGVPDDNPLIVKSHSLGIDVIGELELASQYAKVPVIAVTGTNGKTTTASLIAHCLSNSGRKTVLAGNVGVPLSTVLGRVEKSDWLVLEVSSYQLARTVTFHPEVSVFLNISSDHLDRYSSIDEYFAHKRRLFINQTAGDTAVLNDEEEIIRSIGEEIKTNVLTFSRIGGVKEGAFLESDTVQLRVGGNQARVCSLSSIPIPGRHNLQNILAAVCALTAADCTLEEIEKGIETFRGLSHRLEDLGTHRNIRFINDSKATNVSSTLCAVESVREPIILIMGGRHKGEPYTRLVPIVRDRVKHLIVIGEAAPLIEADMSGSVDTSSAASLEDAMQTALKHASAGDAVLLSPGCSSFDMFDNYEQRGELFKELVDGLGA